MHLRAVHRLHRKGLYFEVDAGNFRSAILLMVARALAKLFKADMPLLAQVKPRRNQYAVDVYASLPFKLKQHAHDTRVVGSAAKDSAATAKNGDREGLDESRRLLDGNSLHLHCPRYAYGLFPVELRHRDPHTALIGAARKRITNVQESNAS